jgi:hypothetical protein
VGVLIPLLLCWVTGFTSVTSHLRLMQQSLAEFNHDHTVFLPATTDTWCGASPARITSRPASIAVTQQSPSSASSSHQQT